jgi:hypothetical protein
MLKMSNFNKLALNLYITCNITLTIFCFSDNKYAYSLYTQS